MPLLPALRALRHRPGRRRRVRAAHSALTALLTHAAEAPRDLTPYRADLGAVDLLLRSDPGAGPTLLDLLADDAEVHVSPATWSTLLARVPSLEPRGRGGRPTVPVPDRRHPARPNGQAEGKARAPRRTWVRQGRLGDCWFVATLAACEHAAPGFVASLVTRRDDGLVDVRLHTPATRTITVSDRVPRRHRAGDRALRPNAASLVEKALAVAMGGDYRNTQGNFAAVALWVLTGRAVLTRPVPRSLDVIARALEEGRPVLASTLVRPGGSFLVPREDDPAGAHAVMDGHVYVARRVLRCDEDGRTRPRRSGPGTAGVVTTRVHLRNPLGGKEGTGRPGNPRRTDLYLSARQFRRAFLSVDIGPRLTP
ncbi:C2 family cysteine protease [Brevibacterium litoralis]|uniref:C2 family cysteine protease n=1 Tax=Brevibacterium litoralis TaxID=3138935 RepID=UPI0032F06523